MAFRARKFLWTLEKQVPAFKYRANVTAVLNSNLIRSTEFNLMFYTGLTRCALRPTLSKMVHRFLPHGLTLTET